LNALKWGNGSKKLKTFYCIYLLIGLLCSQANLYAADVVFRSESDDGTIIFSDTAGNNGKPYQVKGVSNRYLYQVKKAIDGDTILLKNGQRVRLLGVNTPEVKTRYHDAQQGGMAAKEWLQNKLSDRSVYLEFDTQKQDKYKRLLAHAFLASGEHINHSLLLGGWATLTVRPPNVKYSDNLIKAQQLAKQYKQGVWSLPDYQTLVLADIFEQDITGWVRVNLTPDKLEETRKYLKLIDDEFELKIHKDQLTFFESPSVYLEKTIVVQGWVSNYQGRKVMRLYHPSAIEDQPL
jgi:endonuclease YncB( thermonuclease family)